MYGLMAEHANDDIVVWNGEKGVLAQRRADNVSLPLGTV